MKKIRSCLGIMLLIVLSFGNDRVCSAFGAGEEMSAGYQYLNEIRRNTGLLPFAGSSLLERASASHAQYLWLYGHLGHDESPEMPGFTGVWPEDRAAAVGFSGAVSENLTVGDPTVIQAIDTLMGAIYHRLSFLTFDYGAVGSGIAGTTNDELAWRSYVFNMGNGPGLTVEANRSANAGIVRWPADGMEDVLPVFYEETPDPLPDYAVSGYPISLQFNPGMYGQVSLQAFRLFEVESGQEVTNTRVLDYVSDPNSLFTPLEFALFPLQRLQHDTSYRVEVSYSSDRESDTLSWEFRTRKPEVTTYAVEYDGQSFDIPSNTGQVSVYIPPENAPGYDQRHWNYGFGYSDGMADLEIDNSPNDYDTLLLTIPPVIADDYYTFYINMEAHSAGTPKFMVNFVAPDSSAGSGEVSEIATFTPATALYNPDTQMVFLNRISVGNSGGQQGDNGVGAVMHFDAGLQRLVVYQLYLGDDQVPATVAASFNPVSGLLIVPELLIGEQSYQVTLSHVAGTKEPFEFELLEVNPVTQ